MAQREHDDLVTSVREILTALRKVRDQTDSVTALISVALELHPNDLNALLHACRDALRELKKMGFDGRSGHPSVHEQLTFAIREVLNAAQRELSIREAIRHIQDTLAQPSQSRGKAACRIFGCFTSAEQIAILEECEIPRRCIRCDSPVGSVDALRSRLVSSVPCPGCGASVPGELDSPAEPSSQQ